MSDAGPGPGEKTAGPRPFEKPLPPLKYQRRRPAPGSDPPNLREGTGWAVVSYLIGGMLLYGGIGWLIGSYAALHSRCCCSAPPGSQWPLSSVNAA